MNSKDEQKGSVASSNLAQTHHDPNHKCQHFIAYTKNSKNIVRKNRQIETLNKIITNLKSDIQKLEVNKQKEQTQLNRFKQQAEQNKVRMNQLELKCLQYQRQLAQQRLQHASQIKKYSTAKQIRSKKNYHNQYYSECQFSRNTEQQLPMDQLQKHSAFYAVNNNYPRNSKQEFSMGQLFMGKKGKIQSGNELSRASSWSKIELLNQQSKYPSTSFSRNSSKFGLVDVGQITFESALEYLRKQNENLKTSIF